MVLAAVAVFCVGLLIGRKTTSEPSAEKSAQQNVKKDEDKQETSIASQTSTLSGENRRNFQPFDPNTVTKGTLVAMGITEKKAQVLINYRKAGKVFRNPEDILDSYGWTPADLEPLLPYIRISAAYRQEPRAAHQQKSYISGQGQFQPEIQPYKRRVQIDKRDMLSTYEQYTRNKFKTLTLVDPNTADTTLLQRIPGIGSYYSRQIVRLRERLGGIYDVEQLFEINNFPEVTLQWFTISSAPPLRTIDLNTATFKQMAAHPYIGYERTKALQNYIRLYGKITTMEQLRTTRIFSDEELQRILPYLHFP
jgi:DNA uptake protein ComE-like DNA-binding protein